MIVLRRFLLAIAVCTIAATTALGDPETVGDRDRVLGDLETSGEAAIMLDALAGTEIGLKVRGARGSSLEPEILIFGPDDVHIVTGFRYRHAAGSSKAKLKKFTLKATGRYTIVVRALNSTKGAFLMKTSVRHPRKVSDRGHLSSIGFVTPTFPGFEGTEMIFRVKGVQGLTPDVDSVLLPDVREAFVDAVESDDIVASVDPFECPDHADYRLPIESRDGTAGSWRMKIKLVHPPHVASEVVAECGLEGWVTDRMTEAPSPPGPPGSGTPTDSGTVSFRLLESGGYSAISTAENAVARSVSEYVALWARHSPPMPPGLGAPDSAPPVVDFNREIVVGIFAGYRPSGGFDVQVTSVARVGDGLVVRYDSIEPAPNRVVSDVLTTPFTLVAIPRVSGPVTFERTVVIR